MKQIDIDSADRVASVGVCPFDGGGFEFNVSATNDGSGAVIRVSENATNELEFNIEQWHFICKSVDRVLRFINETGDDR